MEQYKKLENQPLKFALAEFRFSAVLKIAEFIPSIQEALRKNFPIQKHRIDQNINFQSNGLEIHKQDRWAFVSSNGRSAIQISQDSLVYVTSEYPRFGGFSNECRTGLDIIKEIVDPALITRIGLRYGDLVLVDKGEQLSDFVDGTFTYPQLFGDIGNPMHKFSENLIQTTTGILAIRTLCGVMSKIILDDENGLPIKLDLVNDPSERMILDFDHFWECREQVVSFDVENILVTLNDLHEPARRAFWELTTDLAREEKWA